MCQPSPKVSSASNPLFRESSRVRYRLLPHIYNVMQQASETGLPAMRPLFLEFPSDGRTWDQDDQFMFGADLVVEELVEGGITRFAAVFHSRNSDPVGPIRSARSTDVGLGLLLPAHVVSRFSRAGWDSRLGPGTGVRVDAGRTWAGPEGDVSCGS